MYTGLWVEATYLVVAFDTARKALGGLLVLLPYRELLWSKSG